MAMSGIIILIELYILLKDQLGKSCPLQIMEICDFFRVKTCCNNSYWNNLKQLMAKIALSMIDRKLIIKPSNAVLSAGVLFKILIEK